jgi:hypothetical protein
MQHLNALRMVTVAATSAPALGMKSVAPASVSQRTMVKIQAETSAQKVLNLEAVLHASNDKYGTLADVTG